MLASSNSLTNSDVGLTLTLAESHCAARWPLAPISSNPIVTKPPECLACRLIHSPCRRRSPEPHPTWCAQRGSKPSCRGTTILSCRGCTGIVQCSATIDPRSTVGSGDSALAGIAQAIRSGASPDEALRLGAACAAANCLADSPGGARLEDIRRFQKEIPVQTLEAGL